MDEAEKYQQRLQAIAEKRKQQEEEERLRREVEEEWLKLAQRKRKSLRDQWLMDVPSALATDGPGTQAPLWPPTQREEGQAKEVTEEGEGNAWREGEEERTTVQDGYQINSTENNANVPCQVNTESYTNEKESQGEVEESVVPSSTFLPMQNGGEERSVLGMLEVQVERDLRTGVTVIKSVAPLPPGDPTGVTVFDDGRKTIRAVSGGASGDADDLDQVLNTLAEVGVPVLLEARGLVSQAVQGHENQEQAQSAKETEMEEELKDTEVETQVDETVQVEDTEEAPEEQREQVGVSESSYTNPMELDPPKEHTLNTREERVGDTNGLYEKVNSADEGVIEPEVEQEEQEEDEEEEEAFRPEEGLDPITLTFLGFSQAASDPGHGNDDDGSLVKVERVLIYEDSEEEEEEGREEYVQDYELASSDTDIRHTSTSLVVRSPKKQPVKEGLAEMDDSCLEPGLATQTDQSQARGGDETEEGSQGGAEAEALELIRAATSGHDPDSLPEVPAHLSTYPILGGRTDGAEMQGEGEVGHGEGAMEKESLDDVFQDVTLDDTQPSLAQEPELQPLALLPSGEPSRAEGVGSPKRKTCQCCSVM